MGFQKEMTNEELEQVAAGVTPNWAGKGTYILIPIP